MSTTVARTPVILNVDDTPTTRRVTTILLQKSGFDVVEAATGKEALILAQELPQLVLLDVNLPDINGFEVCRRLKTDPRTAAIPVVHLSASYVTAEDRITGLEEGADGYLTQPVEPKELIATIKAFLRLKRAEVALRESERWHRALFECSHDALITLAPPAWRFTSGNPAAYAMFRIEKAEEFPACSLWDFSPERQPNGRRSEQFALEMLDQATCKGSSFFQWTLVRASGTEFPVSILLTRIEGDELPLLLATVRDESEKRLLEAKMAQADRLASMGTLAASMAHELNNPLAYVHFNVESLAEDLPLIAVAAERCRTALRELVGESTFGELVGDGAHLLEPNRFEDAIERAREALEGTRRMKSMTRGLGMFSRIELTERTHFDVTIAIESAIGFATSELSQRARVVREYSQLPSVWAAESNLSQVFLNLLVNAAHSIEEGDTLNNQITVRTWTADAMVHVAISDTGKGIAAEALEGIFEPFYTTKPAGVGTGLGLSICKSIVTELGGDISVESQVGKGSTFTVRLPILSSAMTEQRAAKSSAVLRHSSALRGRILVVDDEEGVQHLLARLLGQDHDLVIVSSGEQAQTILEADTAFDVIICDLMMPGMSGMALHEWLAARCVSLAGQVIFVTGGAFTPRAFEYLKSVGNPAFEKPFDTHELQLRVSELIQASRKSP